MEKFTMWKCLQTSRIQENSWTFPAAYFVTSSKAQYYLSTNFRELQTFPHASRNANFLTCLNIHLYSTFKSMLQKILDKERYHEIKGSGYILTVKSV